jgi:hypothetical protein
MPPRQVSSTAQHSMQRAPDPRQPRHQAVGAGYAGVMRVGLAAFSGRFPGSRLVPAKWRPLSRPAGSSCVETTPAGTHTHRALRKCKPLGAQSVKGKMKTEPTQGFQTFHQHVFGDYKYKGVSNL